MRLARAAPGGARRDRRNRLRSLVHKDEGPVYYTACRWTGKGQAVL